MATIENNRAGSHSMLLCSVGPTLALRHTPLYDGLLFSFGLLLPWFAFFSLQFEDIERAVSAFSDFDIVSPAGDILQRVMHFLADFPEISGGVRHADSHPFRFAVVQGESSDGFPEEVFFPDFDFVSAAAGGVNDIGIGFRVAAYDRFSADGAAKRNHCVRFSVQFPGCFSSWCILLLHETVICAGFRLHVRGVQDRGRTAFGRRWRQLRKGVRSAEREQAPWGLWSCDH